MRLKKKMGKADQDFGLVAQVHDARTIPKLIL
jgi:hypothetical protein